MKRLLLFACLWAPAWAQVNVIGPGSHPCLARDNQGHLYLAYENHNDICLRRSDDGGLSWGGETAVCTTPALSKHPRLQVESNGAVDVVWQEGNEVCFSRSQDGVFGTPVTMSHGASEPDLARGSDDSLHLVWAEASKSADVFYIYSNNAGKSWTQPLNLSRTPGQSSHPVLALGGDKLLHVAWVDTTSGVERPDIFAVHGSQDSFGHAYNVSNTAGRSHYPSLTVSTQGRVYLAWMDTSRSKQYWDIYFCRSDDNGPFTPPQHFDTPLDSVDPCLAADDQNHVAVAWSDFSENPKDADVFLVQSGDGGATFTTPKNISYTLGASKYPSLVLLEGKIVTVWEEVEQGGSVLKLVRESVTRKARQSVSSGKY